VFQATPAHKWLLKRVRLICVLVFVFGTLLPPYVPKTAQAFQEVSVATSQFLLVEEGFLLKSASITYQGSRRAYAKGIIHTVKEGESVEKLANRYGISPDTVRWANKLAEENVIHPGDEILVLPVNGVLHNVSRGQTLIGISELYGIPEQDIIEQNSIKGGFILAGQELIIPGGKPIIGKPKIVATAEQPLSAKPKIVAAANKPEQEKPAQKPSQEQNPTEFTSAPTVGVLQKPCSSSCFITQYFNPGHYALDMQEKGGGQIFAAEAGTVIRADYGWNGGFGNVIEIDHGNELITRYAHNKELLVNVGDNIARGQYIANMGNSGLVYGATGIHVHFEVVLKGVKKNPLLYLQ